MLVTEFRQKIGTSINETHC